MIIDGGLKYEKTYGNNLQVVGYTDEIQVSTIVIPEKINDKKVIQIADKAFANNSFIKKIWMPETIELIGQRAFANCTSLESIELTPTMNFVQRLTLTIAPYAFLNCYNLSHFWGRNRIVTLEERCFDECVTLQSLNVYIQQVDTLCFFNCYDLKEITLSPSARLCRNSLVNSSIKTLTFRGDGIIPQSTLDFIKEHNIKIKCVPESNLENLAYSGYHIEIVEKQP